MNYYERHIGDYLKDTAHLSLLEHGIYGRLLDIYYGREAGLPADQIARLVGARSEEEKASLGCVLAEFFVLEAGGLYVQARCEEEIARFQDKQRKAKASAETRWAHTERKADAMRTHTEGNAPSLQTQTPIPKKETCSPPASGFEKFWKAYPRKVGKDAARKAFEKRRPDDALLVLMLAAVNTQAKSEPWRKDGGQFIPHPSTWLNEGRWQDEGVALPSEAPRPVYQAPPRMTAEERERSDAARRAVVGAFHNITPKAA